jgi:AICAR transformylase/IMP cyclohydrolase PurH
MDFSNSVKPVENTSQIFTISKMKRHHHFMDRVRYKKNISEQERKSSHTQTTEELISYDNTVCNPSHSEGPQDFTNSLNTETRIQILLFQIPENGIPTQNVHDAMYNNKLL